MPFCSLVVGAAYESAELRFHWHDQGWGATMGRVRAVLSRGVRRVGVYYTPLAPHHETPLSLELHFEEHFGSLAVAGDTVSLEYKVGLGGGHELFIDAAALTL